MLLNFTGNDSLTEENELSQKLLILVGSELIEVNRALIALFIIEGKT